jgi:predicted enzyme related to lactoylglutathione lyase
MDERSALGRINGILLWTEADRFDDLAAFYRDVLRLPVRTDRPGHLAFEWPDGMRLTLGVHRLVHGPNTEPHRVMLNLGVTDIAAAAEALRGRGVQFVREPSPEPWGGWIATFADPDGNLVQLLQPAP